MTYDHPMGWAGFIVAVLGTIGTIVGTCVTIAGFRHDRRKHSQHAASKEHAEQARGSRSRWVWPNILALDVIVLTILALGIFLITQSRGTPGRPSDQGATRSASTKSASPSPGSGQWGPTPSTAPPSAFYTAQRTLANGYYANLDNPSWAVSSSDAAGATFDLGAYSSGRLEGDSGDWGILNTPGASGYAACASFTAFNNSLMPVSDLPQGTQLCVKTSEGRIGLLKVLSISGLNDDPMITFQVTVWNNHTSSTSSTSASASQPSPASPLVFYTGQRTLANGYYANLDNPSWAVSNSDAAGATLDLGAYSSGRLEGDYGDWGILNTPGASGYAACANFTAFYSGLMPVSDLAPGTQLCVRTSLDRIGLLKVLSISGLNDDPKITFQVTVWNIS